MRARLRRQFDLTRLAHGGWVLQMCCKFQPSRCGAYEGDLYVKYDKEKDFFVKLVGEASDVDIFLESQNMKMETTFTSLQSQKCVRLTNRSDIIAKYEWKQFPSSMEEEERRLTKTVRAPRRCCCARGSPAARYAWARPWPSLSVRARVAGGPRTARGRGRAPLGGGRRGPLPRRGRRRGRRRPRDGGRARADGARGGPQVQAVAEGGRGRPVRIRGAPTHGCRAAQGRRGAGRPRGVTYPLSLRGSATPVPAHAAAAAAASAAAA